MRKSPSGMGIRVPSALCYLPELFQSNKHVVFGAKCRDCGNEYV
jgi:hypothetical protein